MSNPEMSKDQILEALERVKQFQSGSFDAMPIAEAKKFIIELIGDLSFATRQLVRSPPEEEQKWGAGDSAKWHQHGTVLVGTDEYQRKHRLIYGEHPHSRADNRHYIASEDGDEPIGFSGHRILVSLSFRSYNYHKSSYFSGEEIRAGGNCIISLNNEPCYEFFYRELDWALHRVRHLINVILEHPICYWDPEEESKILGRPMFYREIRCFPTRIIRSQGCLMIARADGLDWPPEIYEDDPTNTDREKELKIDIVDTSAKIWFFDNPKAPNAGGISSPGYGNSNLSRPADLSRNPIHNDQTQRRSRRGSGESRESDERQRESPDAGDEGSSNPGAR